MINDSRVLDVKDIAELETATSTLVEQALDAGNIAKAREYLHRLVAETKACHDSYVEWTTGLLGYIHQHLGDDALLDATRQTYGRLSAPLVDVHQDKSIGLKERVELTAAMLRAHAGPLVITEDDEKIAVGMRQCGSGGWLINNQKYEPEGYLQKVPTAQPLTFGREDLPIYCTHCAFSEMDAIHKTGRSLLAMTPGTELGRDVCTWNIYKDPDAIPEAHYRTFGCTKDRSGDDR